MKILSSVIHDDLYHDIVVQRRFLWFTWEVRYRKCNKFIFRYSQPNGYKLIGVSEYCAVHAFFKIPIHLIKD